MESLDTLEVNSLVSKLDGLVRQGQYRDAINVSMLYPELVESDISASLLVIDALFKCGFLPESFQKCKRLLSKYPEVWQAYAFMVTILLELKLTFAANKVAFRATSLFPSIAELAVTEIDTARHAGFVGDSLLDIACKHQILMHKDARLYSTVLSVYILSGFEKGVLSVLAETRGLDFVIVECRDIILRACRFLSETGVLSANNEALDLVEIITTDLLSCDIKQDEIAYDILLRFSRVYQEKVLIVTATHGCDSTTCLSISLAPSIHNAYLEGGSSYQRINELVRHIAGPLLRAMTIVHGDFMISFNPFDYGSPGSLSYDLPSSERYWLMPDPYLLKGAENLSSMMQIKEYEQFCMSWADKKSIAFWRGSTTGAHSFDDLITSPRYQFCACSSAKSQIDAKFSHIVQLDQCSAEFVWQHLSDLGLLGNPVPEAKFACYKYFPDLPGNACAWGTFAKYLSGQLVFSSHKKRCLHYYQYLHPWVHYVPVKDDFSDFHEKLDWAVLNNAEAMRIAWSGYRQLWWYASNVADHVFASIIGGLECLEQSKIFGASTVFP